MTEHFALAKRYEQQIVAGTIAWHEPEAAPVAVRWYMAMLPDDIVWQWSDQLTPDSVAIKLDDPFVHYLIVASLLEHLNWACTSHGAKPGELNDMRPDDAIAYLRARYEGLDFQTLKTAFIADNRRVRPADTPGHPWHDWGSAPVYDGDGRVCGLTGWDDD